MQEDSCRPTGRAILDIFTGSRAASATSEGWMSLSRSLNTGAVCMPSQGEK